MFYFVTGKLGNGKTLCAVSKIRDRLRAGLPVATNLDLNLSKLLGRNNNTCIVIRVPDKPTVADLDIIGNANKTYDEKKNGLLVLDECGTWFNSRSWNDKSRSALNDWLLHARKLGWDVILIVQDIEIIDKQARLALSEYTVFCKRTNAFRIPIISPICKFFFGFNITPPSGHVGRVVYGDKVTDPLNDRWWYKGKDLYSSYDTKQTFLTDYPHSTFSYLRPWLQVGRYKPARNLKFYRRVFKHQIQKFTSLQGLLAGAVLGTVFLSACSFVEIKSVVASVATEVEEVEEVESVDSLDIIFDGYIYASKFDVGRGAEFTIRHPTKPAQYSKTLQFEGFVFQEVNYCLLRIRKGIETVLLHCP